MKNSSKKKIGNDIEMKDKMILKSHQDVSDLRPRVKDIEDDITKINALINQQNKEIFHLRMLIEEVCKRNTDSMEIVEILNRFREEKYRKKSVIDKKDE